MSINSVKFGPGERPVSSQGEGLMPPSVDATVTLSIPPTRQGPKRAEIVQGRLWVTECRVIFAAHSMFSTTQSSAASSDPPGYDVTPALTSFEIRHTSIQSCTYNLPTFSANYILLTFLPAPGSSLPDPGTGQSLELKIVVGQGSGHRLWKIIEGERNRAEERRTEADNEALPVYEPIGGVPRPL
ncbi:hypothetical protein L202_07475 [Cryptococcus amylolentus CBS 6039]|uniref:Uncharacterized protein n=1 Tax=Cryptococcus amylolentus CBS 6039 TaxID=1295533 RepID=A0A1E3HEX3_9TREE|nr:hypothetical protein L202_07475 [Cryptococcus amylolentus CBS 6039]ODN73981.1 hypothetical protein L202_07475 [Cryptococcus amylolentus CBS 6039]